MVIYVKLYYHDFMGKTRKNNPLGLYHTFNRGNNQEDIFCDDLDRIVFLKILIKYTKQYNILIYAYCLMRNHFHLYIDDVENNLSAFMRDFEARYAEYFRKKYKRTGHLFQGRFGSCNVRGYRYSIKLIRYISRNPIKADIVKLIKEYKWSSFGKSNDIYEIVDIKYVEIIFQNANCDMETYLHSDEDDHMIAAIEKQRYSDEQAAEQFHQILNDELNIGIIEFKKQEKEVKMKVLMKCRYLGVSVRQLNEVTGFPISFIRRANPKDLGYL